MPSMPHRYKLNWTLKRRKRGVRPGLVARRPWRQRLLHLQQCHPLMCLLFRGRARPWRCLLLPLLNRLHREALSLRALFTVGQDARLFDESQLRLRALQLRARRLLRSFLPRPVKFFLRPRRRRQRNPAPPPLPLKAWSLRAPRPQAPRARLMYALNALLRMLPKQLRNLQPARSDSRLRRRVPPLVHRLIGQGALQRQKPGA